MVQYKVCITMNKEKNERFTYSTKIDYEITNFFKAPK